MKLTRRLLLFASLVILLLIVLNVKTCNWLGGAGGNTIEVQKSTVDMGRLILGNKISIRDNIIVRQTGNLKVDGNYLGLGNENKQITLSFITELGYRPSDIIRSEKIDSIKGDEIISRALFIELPLPDTLLYIPKNMKEKSNEWFWEGWYKDDVNKRARKLFIKNLINKSYFEMKKVHVTNNPTKTAMEATKTLYNYVNNAYKIGNDKGFDSIYVTFSFMDGVQKNTINVHYNGKTISSPGITVEDQNL